MRQIMLPRLQDRFMKKVNEFALINDIQRNDLASMADMSPQVLSQLTSVKTDGTYHRTLSTTYISSFIEAGLLGLIGGVVGIIFGVTVGIFGVLAINDFIGATTQPQINIVLILGALIGSFIIGSVSGIVPAIRAAKQHPVDALRS